VIVGRWLWGQPEPQLEGIAEAQRLR